MSDMYYQDAINNSNRELSIQRDDVRRLNRVNHVLLVDYEALQKNYESLFQKYEALQNKHRKNQAESFFRDHNIDKLDVYEPPSKL
jgi:hypothetical protein